MRPSLLCLAMLALAPAVLVAQDRRPLDHDVYDGWRTVEDEQISKDGAWVVYSVVPQLGDAELHVRGVTSGARYAVPRGRAARFTADGSHVVFLIKPELSAVQQAKRAKTKPDELPKDSLGVLDLASGDVNRVADVKSFKVPEDEGRWVAWLLATTPETQDSVEERDQDVGVPLVIQDLMTAEKWTYQHVTEFEFAKNGQRLAYAASTPDGVTDGVYVALVGDGIVEATSVGAGVYKSLTFDDAGEQLAFLMTRDDPDAEQPESSLYRWHGGGEATSVATSSSAGIAQGWWVSEHRSPEFSANGQRLFFATAPRPAPEVPDSTPDDERVKVDIWNWKDPLLQPMQLLQAKEEQRRGYLAVAHLSDNRIVQLATPDVPDVEFRGDGDADLAVAWSDRPYRQEISWDFPRFYDRYVVDVRTGEHQLIVQRMGGSGGSFTMSPDGEYVGWWDRDDAAWYVTSVNGGETVDVTGAIPYPVHNEEHDWPYAPNPYGIAGWTEGDRELLVYDRYDIWAVDPRGQRPPRNVTDGLGRLDSLRLRYVQLNSDQPAIPRDEMLLLSALSFRTKASGFYRDRVDADARAPEQMVLTAHRFSRPTRASDADVLMFTRQSVAEFPNLWVSSKDLDDMQVVSDANPQQANYRWATVETVSWRSTEGTPLEGLLYKPDDFDPSQRYPMIVYFYERNSNNLHAHSPPIPHRSVIRPTFYASRGYLVFIPDIVYEVGYPGESAMDAVIPGVLELIRTGYVDEENIGVQGHSWGGYQIAYMVTRTNIFKAAAGGAPVSNMTSAYGGIRWGSGMSRMFQYEKTQSRIGATLWEAPVRYIENSPLFWADKVETPLLMMHNDHDGAVPWYQGIEMFVALRRLGKPAWLINYNDEPHWPTTYPNKKDWNVRMQQFFDHYLKGHPAPVWLAEGVPAVRKGATLGLELVGEKEVATGGGGGN